MAKGKVEGMTFQRWRNKGVDVIAPTYVRTLMAVMAGATTVRQVAERIGMAETTAAGHLKRLRGWGLVDWSATRAGTIHPLVRVVDVPMVNHGALILCFEHQGSHESESDRITNVMDLRKGDMLIHEGTEHRVKEVRKGKRSHLAAIRLVTDPGECWVRIPVDKPIEGRRTAEATIRLIGTQITL